MMSNGDVMSAHPLTYNIPIKLIERFRGHRLIVRSSNPAKLAAALSQDELKDVEYVQILTLAGNVGGIANWGVHVPMDLVIFEPGAEYRKLHNYTDLLTHHPVRVTVPVRPGFANAVKLAGSLNFAIKLTLGQPGAKELEELFSVLEVYLHQATFSQPVEFFQGVMLSFFRGEPATIWEILEEDPSQTRYITRDGTEMISPRFLGITESRSRSLQNYVDEFEAKLLAEKRECLNCEFRSNCRGYFKWPNRDYLCAGGIKKVFAVLKDAANELSEDMAEYSAYEKGMHA